MESSSKIWLRRFLVIVPVLCILVSMALCERTRDEADDIETVKRELKAYFEAESKKLRDEVERLVKRKLEIQNQIDADKEKIKQQLTEVMDMVASVRREKRHAVGSCGGAVYVHWGREDCSSTAQPVYTGIAGGGLSTHPGAAVNMLCMTHTPGWGKHGNNANYFTYLYGAEYKVASNDFPLGHQRAQAIHNHDVPCTVCQSYNRSNTIMIPGTTVCEAGWTTEYSGYLMAGRSDQAAATEYNCIDANPDTHESGSSIEGGRLLYRVKAKCGALPCSPYVEMRELTCVVCTK